MKVQIIRGHSVDVGDALRRSPVGDIPGANEIMDNYLESSIDVFTGFADDQVACIFGLIAPTVLSDRAYLWMLHTNLVEQNKFLFIRHSQIWVRRVLQTYNEIYGHALLGNDPGIRWLRWLGATFDEPDGKHLPFQIRKQ